MYKRFILPEQTPRNHGEKLFDNKSIQTFHITYKKSQILSQQNSFVTT